MVTPKATPKTILGLQIEPGRILAIQAARNGQGLRIKKTHSFALSLDPLSSDPELFGQELRNHLHEAGIHETHCLLTVPIRWILKHRLEMPVLSGEDKQNYIRLHAEREFPFTLEELSLSLSSFETPDGQSYATLAAIPLTYIRTLESALRAAKLKPIHITIGYPGATESPSQETVFLIQKNLSGADFLVLHRGRVVSFRWIEDVEEESEKAGAESLFREIRLTISELPDRLQKQCSTVYLSGSETWAERTRASVHEAAIRYDFDLHIAPIHEWRDLAKHPMTGCAQWALQGTLERFFLNQGNLFDFLPPKINRLQQWFTQVSSRRNLLAGGAAAAVLLFGVLAFLFQHFTVSRLEAEWQTIETQVAEVETLQQNIKQFRPWFDTSFPTLRALQTLTRAFPEEGSIWAKTVEIENITQISCIGLARDNQALLRMLDHLNNDEQVKQLQVEQVQGKGPFQFGFNFLWFEG